MTLCVKAEEMALLALSFNIEGEEKYLEEIAKVAKPDAEHHSRLYTIDGILRLVLN